MCFFFLDERSRCGNGRIAKTTLWQIVVADVCRFVIHIHRCALASNLARIVMGHDTGGSVRFKIETCSKKVVAHDIEMNVV